MHKYTGKNSLFVVTLSHPNFPSNMSFLPCYRLPPTSRKHVLATRPSAPPLTLCLDLHVDTDEPELEPVECESSQSSRGINPDNAESLESSQSSRGSTPDSAESMESPQGSRGNTPDDADTPETSRSKGSFNWDHEKGGFSLEWADLAEFFTWRQEEERVYSIEFIASSSRTRGTLWSRRQLFVCGREASGGYVKKLPGRERKAGTRKTGCCCQIMIKQYPHTSTVLGRYIAEHDHEVGFANIAYTRLSSAARE